MSVLSIRSAMLVAAFALLPLATGCQRPNPAGQAKGPPPKEQVFFVRPIRQTVEEYEEFPGRTWATDTIEVRARVTGYLNKIHFKDGAKVSADDLLAEIDPEPFKAEVARAVAAIAQATARHKKLLKQEARAVELLQSGVRAITEEEYEAVVADREEAAATIDAAKAALRIAELNLGYTEVRAPRAPFDAGENEDAEQPQSAGKEDETETGEPRTGRIGRRLVDPGNLVKADETVLATIVVDDPIYVYFDLDERTVIRLKRLISEGKLESIRGAGENEGLKVRLALADEEKFEHEGVVNFVDNQLDPTTGTLRCRATVKNEGAFLSPGMFVRLRFPIGGALPAILVPEESLMTDQGQRQVYVINAQDEVESRRVTTGVLIDGLRVIQDGIRPEDRVVVTGLQRIKKKTPVEPVDRTKDNADDPAKTAAAG